MDPDQIQQEKHIAQTENVRAHTDLTNAQAATERVKAVLFGAIAIGVVLIGLGALL